MIPVFDLFALIRDLKGDSERRVDPPTLLQFHSESGPQGTGDLVNLTLVSQFADIQ